MRSRLLFVPVLAVALAGLAAAGGAPLANPSFESGDLDGWSAWVPPGGALAVVATSEYHDPVEGAHFALLKTNGPGSYTRIWQTFTAKAGDTLGGWAFFKSNDFWPFNDACHVRLLAGGDTGPVHATLYEEDVESVGNYGLSDWTWFEHTFTAAGTYTIEASVANIGDSMADSMMGLDGIVLGSTVLEVEVDVKPGSKENVINTKSRGVVPVAILGSAGLDVRQIDVSALRFGPKEASEAHGRGHYEDVNGDGALDLVVHFRVQECGFESQDETATLTGTLTGVGARASSADQAIEGSDRVRVK